MAKKTITLPFYVGDPLWYVASEESSNGPGFFQIRRDPEGVRGIMIDSAGDFLVVDEEGGTDRPGSQYACLSEKDALDWVRTERPGSILLDGTERAAVLTDADGTKSVRTAGTDLNRLAELVGDGRLAASGPDGDGYLAVYGANARKNGAPLTAFALDRDGNPVDVMFGPFLVFHTETDPETGLIRLTDVPADMLNGPDEA